MNHVTTKGEPKIVNRCSYPLTAPHCVRCIFTDLAVIEVTPGGLLLREVARGLDPAAVQAKTGVPLRVPDDFREMEIPAAFNGVRLTA